MHSLPRSRRLHYSTSANAPSRRRRQSSVKQSRRRRRGEGWAGCRLVDVRKCLEACRRSGITPPSHRPERYRSTSVAGTWCARSGRCRWRSSRRSRTARAVGCLLDFGAPPGCSSVGIEDATFISCVCSQSKMLTSAGRGTPRAGRPCKVPAPWRRMAEGRATSILRSATHAGREGEHAPEEGSVAD